MSRSISIYKALARLGGLLLFLSLPLVLYPQIRPKEQAKIIVGAERSDYLYAILKDKRVALVVNQSSVVGEQQVHLLDTLLNLGVDVRKIMVPEHGFRGNIDAGASVKDGKDVKSGLTIHSLYGKNKKPTREMLKGIDYVVFDMQDVGTRFFTYISTMHYVMEACAENNVALVVCDRPNPNDYVDGPILKPDCKSFVGMHPIPIVHGLTVGELARMINGEGWLKKGIKCELSVIPMKGWKHGEPYQIPIKPSPNLPNDHAINWYPSLCLFEGTIMSVGRGTEMPFEVLGYPNKSFGRFRFIPQAIKGMDSNPLYKGRACYGEDLRRKDAPSEFSLAILLYFANIAKQSGIRFISRPQMFNLLAGDKALARQIEAGYSEKRIRESWKKELDEYKKLRKAYLIYEEE